MQSKTSRLDLRTKKMQCKISRLDVRTKKCNLRLLGLIQSHKKSNLWRKKCNLWMQSMTRISDITKKKLTLAHKICPLQLFAKWSSETAKTKPLEWQRWQNSKAFFYAWEQSVSQSINLSTIIILEKIFLNPLKMFSPKFFWNISPSIFS